MRDRLLSGCFIALAAAGALFLIVPILILLARALASQAWASTEASAVAQALVLSAFTTSAAVGLTLIVGTPLAYLLARRRFRGRRWLEVLVALPIVLPPAVAGLALLATFGRRGAFGPLLESLGITLPFTTAAVVLAQVFVAAPFFIRSAQLGFSSISAEVADQARVDGASEPMLFARIMLPLARRGLLVGAILCGARALGEFGATILFAGSLQGRTQTMPLLIYNILERDVSAALWAGVLLIGAALVALIAAQLVRGSDGDWLT